MTQIIIYENSNGGVSVTKPSGEISIEEVLAKDCPDHAFIVDDSILPKGADAEFFNAWELSGSIITVNLDKAKKYKLDQFNSEAVFIAQKRQLNVLAGLENTPDDATWSANLSSGRSAIASATSTEQLLTIENPK